MSPARPNTWGPLDLRTLRQAEVHRVLVSLADVYASPRRTHVRPRFLKRGGYNPQPSKTMTPHLNLRALLEDARIKRRAPGEPPMTWSALAGEVHCGPEHLSRVLAGRRALSPALAKRMSTALRIPLRRIQRAAATTLKEAAAS